MSSLHGIPVASWGESALALPTWLHRLHQRRRLVPLLREAAVEQFLLDHARQNGLSISPDELQQAADAFRQRQGLTSAEQTRAWLAGQRLSVTDLEDVLERDLLIARLKHHLTRDRIAPHFEAHREGYARARLQLLLLPREDLARELLLQLHEEGRDFSDLAHEQGLSLTHAEVWRQQLTPTWSEPIFSARVGKVVGPLVSWQGFHLALVEALQPPELDEVTMARIRQELFNAWMAERLRDLPLNLPLLDDLTCRAS